METSLLDFSAHGRSHVVLLVALLIIARVAGYHLYEADRSTPQSEIPVTKELTSNPYRIDVEFDDFDVESISIPLLFLTGTRSKAFLYS